MMLSTKQFKFVDEGGASVTIEVDVVMQQIVEIYANKITVKQLYDVLAGLLENGHGG